MYLYNMQKMNIQLLILGKGVTVKAYISFEKKLVLFVIAVFALCTGIYFELVTLSYLIHVYIENRFLGSLYKNFFIRMFGNIVQSINVLDFKRFFFVYFCPVFISMCALEAEFFFSRKKIVRNFYITSNFASQ